MRADLVQQLNVIGLVSDLWLFDHHFTVLVSLLIPNRLSLSLVIILNLNHLIQRPNTMPSLLNPLANLLHQLHNLQKPPILQHRIDNTRMMWTKILSHLELSVQQRVRNLVRALCYVTFYISTKF